MATLRQLNHQVCLSFFIFFFIFWHIWRFFKVSNCWNLKNQQNISRQVIKSLAQPALNSFLHEILESAKSDMNLFGCTIIPLEPILDYGTLSKKKKSKTHWFQALRQTIIIYLIKLHQFLFQYNKISQLFPTFFRVTPNSSLMHLSIITRRLRRLIKYSQKFKRIN